MSKFALKILLYKSKAEFFRVYIRKGSFHLKDYKAKNIRNVVFAGHASAGKTSLVEAAYYMTGKSDRLGTIAEGNTVSDFDAEEIRRKSSVSASIIPCEWKDVKINVIDTPGQFDFSASVSEGFRAAGSSVIVISGKSGVSVGAKRPSMLLLRRESPKFSS